MGDNGTDSVQQGGSQEEEEYLPKSDQLLAPALLARKVQRPPSLVSPIKIGSKPIFWDFL